MVEDEGTATTWEVLVATARGATHESDDLPIQDAAGFVGELSSWDSAVVLAVADGHGDERHFRSARGSELAVDVAEAVGVELSSRLRGCTQAADVHVEAVTAVVPTMTKRWTEAVLTDAAVNPLSDHERRLATANDASIPYGTTLLTAILVHPWLVLCQIGDGDIVMVDMDATCHRPIPDDPRLDGQRTTSMCQPDASSAFRVAVLDTRLSRPGMLLLATDGFGNAQTANPWQEVVGLDLLRFARDRGIEWVRDQLPIWAARCASSEGSGDDTSVILMFRSDLASARILPVSLHPGADTDPLRTVLSPVAPNLSLPREVAGQISKDGSKPQWMPVIVWVLAILMALAVGIGIWLGTSAGSPPRHTPTSTTVSPHAKPGSDVPEPNRGLSPSNSKASHEETTTTSSNSGS